MKKRLTTVANYVLAGLLFVSLNSCKKKEETPTTGTAQSGLGSATITGRVYADLDWTSNGNDPWGGNLEPVVGKTIIFSVSSGDQYLNNATDIPTVDKVYTTTTDANGQYTLTIEVGKNDQFYVWSSINVQDFEYDVVTGGTPATQRTTFTDNWRYFYTYGNYYWSSWYLVSPADGSKTVVDFTL